jgi:hypothetical protein
MTDLDHRAGRCSLVRLSNEKAPSPSGHAHPPAPARLQPPLGRSRPTHGQLPIPFPPGLARIHCLDPTTGSVRSG